VREAEMQRNRRRARLRNAIVTNPAGGLRRKIGGNAPHVFALANEGLKLKWQIISPAMEEALKRHLYD
jgi:hypothetical protein